MTIPFRLSKLSAASSSVSSSVLALVLLVSCGGQDIPGGSTEQLTLRSQSNLAVVDPATAAAKNFTGNGIYWNAAESGTGMFFEAQGNTGVASFFMYEAGTGKAIWYVAAGAFTAGAVGTYSFSGTLQSFKGGQGIASTGVAAVPTATSAGVVNINFVGNSATIRLPNRTINATRYEFGGPGGLNKPATGVQPETGIFWNDTQGGRGFTVEVQNNLVITTMYHYNADGSPTWNFMVGDITTGVASGAFNGQTNGQTLAGAYVAPTAPVSAGNLRLEFAGACEGKVTFNNQAAINVKRFAFGDLPAGKECRSATAAPAPATSGTVPHSGLTALQCYAAGSNTLVSCTTPGATGLNAQQDGMRTTLNAMAYSAVGAYPVTSCVRDNVTGLTWEGKEASGARSGKNTYTNYETAFGATVAQTNAATNAAAYVVYVNSLGLCGYSNWRLPTVAELETIQDLSRSSPAINPTWFPNTASSIYWTSSPYVDSTNAWVVYFGKGGAYDELRSFSSVPVRLVR